uniref:Odorant receptor n=1 Tax=Hycleus phaleratus TaxID=1248972 RepID=A0A2U9NJL3_9CUCU|nr:OR4 [Hycleus phaleratus]
MERLLNTFQLNDGDKLTKILTVPGFALKLIGVWPQIDKSNRIGYKFYGIFLYLSIMLLHTLSQVAALTLVYNNLDLLIETIYVFLTNAAVCFKTVYYFRNQKLYKSIIETLDEEVFQPKNSHQRRIVQKFVNIWRDAFLFYEIAAILSVGSWAIYPMLKRTLPFVSWYPFDSTKSPYFELMYIHQIASIQYAAFLNIMGDSVLGAIMMCCAAFCAILNDNLRNMYGVTKENLIKLGKIADDSSDRAKEIIYDNYTGTLVKFIDYHRRILAFTQHCNSLSDTLSMCQFAATLLTLITVMYRLSIVSPTSGEFFNLVSFQTAICLQISMFCCLGDFVIVESMEISQAIYESDWYNAPISFQKNMIIFMSCTARPIQFRALRFFILSIETFGRILRSAWSYFAVLRQHHQNRQ